MLNRLPNTNTHLDNERLSLVRAKLELLVKAITKHRQVTDSQLLELRQLLETLPLATADFAVASKRLRNVRRYLLDEEVGAACYEIKLLVGGLRSVW